jgi:hypothetical protein
MAPHNDSITSETSQSSKNKEPQKHGNAVPKFVGSKKTHTELIVLLFRTIFTSTEYISLI